MVTISNNSPCLKPACTFSKSIVELTTTKKLLQHEKFFSMVRKSTVLKFRLHECKTSFFIHARGLNRDSENSVLFYVYAYKMSYIVLCT